jgi:hypothetical protein
MPRNAAAAMGEAAGRAERDQELRRAAASRPTGETPKAIRTVVLIAAVILFAPVLFIPFYLLPGLGVHAAAAAVGAVGLLLAWPLRKPLRSFIGLHVCISAGLLASVAENMVNNRPPTVQNLFFPMFIAVVLGLAATAVLSVRRRRKTAG